MERKLFDWCGWDQPDVGTFKFTGCTLKVPIGAFKVGELVPVILVNFDGGRIQLLAKDGNLLSEHTIHLTLDN